MTRLIVAIGAIILATLSVAAEEKVKATLYKNPDCACCEHYAEYLRAWP